VCAEQQKSKEIGGNVGIEKIMFKENVYHQDLFCVLLVLSDLDFLYYLSDL